MKKIELINLFKFQYDNTLRDKISKIFIKERKI